MMMTVKQLKNALEAFPEDAAVLVHRSVDVASYIEEMQAVRYVELFSGLVALTDREEDRAGVMLISEARN